MDLAIIVTDATTGNAMAARRGLCKVRHIAAYELCVEDMGKETFDDH